MHAYTHFNQCSVQHTRNKLQLNWVLAKAEDKVTSIPQEGFRKREVFEWKLLALYFKNRLRYKRVLFTIPISYTGETNYVC